jgi:hypothetical protein
MDTYKEIEDTQHAITMIEEELENAMRQGSDYRGPVGKKTMATALQALRERKANLERS